MTRPAPKRPRVLTVYREDPAVRDELNAEAERRGLSLSEVIRERTARPKGRKDRTR